MIFMACELIGTMCILYVPLLGVSHAYLVPREGRLPHNSCHRHLTTLFIQPYIGRLLYWVTNIYQSYKFIIQWNLRIKKHFGTSHLERLPSSHRFKKMVLNGTLWTVLSREAVFFSQGPLSKVKLEWSWNVTIIIINDIWELYIFMTIIKW